MELGASVCSIFAETRFGEVAMHSTNRPNQKEICRVVGDSRDRLESFILNSILVVCLEVYVRGGNEHES